MSHTRAKGKASFKRLKIINEFSYAGFDTFEPLKLVGGIEMIDLTLKTSSMQRSFFKLETKSAREVKANGWNARIILVLVNMDFTAKDCSNSFLSVFRNSLFKEETPQTHYVCQLENIFSGW